MIKCAEPIAIFLISEEVNDLRSIMLLDKFNDSLPKMYIFSVNSMLSFISRAGRRQVLPDTA